MRDSVLSTQPKNFTMFNPKIMTPADAIATVGELGLNPRHPALANPTLPILAATVDWNVSRGASCYVGHGMLPFADFPILTFRFQVGSKMQYWLADPADPEILAMMQKWVKARRMGAALEIGGETILAGRDYLQIPPAILAVHKHTEAKGKKAFVLVAGELIASGILGMQATSDIPSVPRLERVDACVIRTRRVDSAFAELSNG